MPDRLAQDRGDDALRCALHQLHRERAADAVAEEQELVDAEMVHHAELIGRRTRPRDRRPAPGRWTRRRVALRWSMVMMRKSPLNSSGMLITARAQTAMAGVQPAAGRRQQRKA